jgi:hypothetical protein
MIVRLVSWVTLGSEPRETTQNVGEQTHTRIVGNINRTARTSIHQNLGEQSL